ncbi:hypothetical protein SRB5_44130 [Streptomyces sp. RB5]|uniref:Integrin-like protein n=1 Tax=Streptomyces smaragdinus TaxID=2585196 RepID=A0A7K0CL85_9ACTN|nr:FG-GAP-like repeat-containing protein [Streptomyces smaragdinus]MQY14250.1 hypothetical protein [Streptomyces smaragdinus]
MTNGKRTAAAALLTLTAALLTAPPAAAAPEAKPYDFNGDGYQDLTTGVPRGTANGQAQAGYLSVVPGGPNGPDAARRFTVSQSTTGIPGGSEAGDHFGGRFTSADLNADGCADLIVSAPGEDEATGRITILWGARTGGFTRGTLLDGTIPRGGYGAVGIAVAETTGDGVPEIVTADQGPAGAALTVAPGPFAPGEVPAVPFQEDPAGAETVYHAMAAGDFNGDGRTDFAVTISSPYFTATTFWQGSDYGLDHAIDWDYSQAYGTALAAADFDGDGTDDLVYGNATHGSSDSPDWDPYWPMRTGVGGSVRVLYGAQWGPASFRRPQDLSQETPNIPGSGLGAAEQGDGFGKALAVGDMNGDGYADLAIGLPGEDIGTAPDAGAVTVLFGSVFGLTTETVRNVQQESAGIPGSNEKGDAFGKALAARDLNGDTWADLTIGQPGEDTGQGRVIVLPNAAPAGVRWYSPASLALPGPHAGLAFGSLLGD